MRSPALQFFGGLAMLMLLLLAGLQLSCRTQAKPTAYRSQAQYLRSSAIRSREAEAEYNSAREAQRRARSLQP